MLIHRLSASFTRPADTTAYASGDLVANSTTAGSVTPMQFRGGAHYINSRGAIRRAHILKSDAGTTNASFRVHIYTSSPTVTNGDNGAWLSTESGWIGSFDVTVDKAFASDAGGAGVPTSGQGEEVNYRIGGQVLYGLLEARGAYTPASEEVFTVTLEIVQD